MKFMIMHKGTPSLERGDPVTPELVERVGAMVGDLVKKGQLVDGDGLRQSAMGVRVHIKGNGHTATPGPFPRGNELPAGFTSFRARNLEEAAEKAAQLGRIHGVTEVDVRPFTEEWDLTGQPRPDHVTTTRYMALRKVTPAFEAGLEPTAAQKEAHARWVKEAGEAHLASYTLKPSRHGRRCTRNGSSVTVTDGPFTETKELISGYVLVELPSLEEATRMASEYLLAMEVDEVDIREAAE